MAIDFWQPVILVILGSILLNSVLSSVTYGLDLSYEGSTALLNTIFVVNLLYQTMAILFLIRLFDPKANKSMKTLLGVSFWKMIIPFLILNLFIFFSILIGSFFFIVPGVLLMVWLSVAAYIMVLEGASIVDSYKRSYRLIRGWGWLMFGRLLYLLALVTLIALIGVVPQVGALVSSILALLLSVFTVLYIGLTYQDLVGIEKNKVLASSSLSIWKKILLVIVAAILFFSLALFTALGDFVRDVMANNDIASQEVLY